MINEFPKYIAICLLSTVLVEVIASLIMKVRDKKDILNIALANVLTNPIVVVSSTLVNIFWGSKARLLSLIFLESLAILIEGYIYKKNLNYRRINPYILSIILNIMSYSVGLLINRFI